MATTKVAIAPMKVTEVPKPGADFEILEPGLVISKIYMGYCFWGRPTMEDLRQDLRYVTKKCRPDWDTPRLK
jgi:hypothetical protein